MCEVRFPFVAYCCGEPGHMKASGRKKAVLEAFSYLNGSAENDRLVEAYTKA